MLNDPNSSSEIPTGSPTVADNVVTHPLASVKLRSYVPLANPLGLGSVLPPGKWRLLIDD